MKRKESTIGIKHGKNPLDILQVIDRLEIGPVRVEPKRIVAPYVVVQDGRQDRIDLIYRYEEAVFDPSDVSSQNLASMICAQAAINYGLFCRSIVFNDSFDEIDIRFIKEMIENTAREIYVKKFLEKNPFLRGNAAQIPAVKLSSYSRSNLEFRSLISKKTKSSWESWSAQRKKIAVLSSGGKDSLLSFGLLNEIDQDTHPIFVNESGRHWYTALNSYRYFRENMPNTSRVWMNGDRVFAWMLRHLPFVRKDFASVRSDEYPIRLWTVAVFLFGVLPIIRKRGIGCLVIGDEYDSTRRVVFNGIRHYDGLYDQSYYFDNYLSRYFLQKAWSICQFSILRPLSEVLVLKILVERYPELQKRQISCHAAHIEQEMARPCGKCEKCGRVVGMLMAIGANPQHCGYTHEQIKKSLTNLVAKGTHQEFACEQQIKFMLMQKGLLDKSDFLKDAGKEYPETLKIRFDPECSPIDVIPADLRLPLYKIYLAYAKGAAQKMGRIWTDFDPLTETEGTKAQRQKTEGARVEGTKDYRSNVSF